jgi:hypothetical protein
VRLLDVGGFLDEGRFLMGGFWLKGNTIGRLLGENELQNGGLLKVKALLKVNT